MDNESRYIVQVYVGALSPEFEALSIEALKSTSAEEMVACIVDKLQLPLPIEYELAEVVGNSVGQECKERRLGPHENPVALMLLWPKLGLKEKDEPLAAQLRRLRRTSSRIHGDGQSGADDGVEEMGAADEVASDDNDHQEYRFYLREKLSDSNWSDSVNTDPQLIRDYFYRFLYQPKDREYPDLCQLPDLNEDTLMENLRARFQAGHIYTYVGSILIAVNPFKFYPIYNPKYVKLYQNRRLGELPPHIFAVADAAYHAMLRDRKPQCIVISGESGSGKTESTNFLLHHLTALSHKGSHGSGVEQTILSAGPVLEAFGNAKTCHNNNSSRFGKFIQVTYRENGQVHGALVQKYLLEKTRICFQAKNERNYHVFYHLLVGASPQEKHALHLQPPHSYRYLNQSDYHDLDQADESYELSRLKQSMEMVGFCTETQRRVFAVLSAVLHIGNVEFQPKKSTYHHDESVSVKNGAVVSIIANLLKVKEEILHQALISKRARASGETLVINYRMPEAIAARDAMAKCLYGSLFDWIVLQLNHALLAKKDPDKVHMGYSIGVLDIFGFEDFGNMNSFEQFCINYANEHLQYYFNQHVFKYEQEEYKREGIHWVNIQFVDNTGCLQLYESKPNGLLCILDDQCNFPGATNETLLQKFNSVNKDNEYYEVPQKREAAFIVRHYAGRVKYQSCEFREKNLDLMKADMVAVLKSSQLSFVRELVGGDPVAVFRWAILRAFIRAYFAFSDSGRRHRELNTEKVVLRSSKGKTHHEVVRKNRPSKARCRPSKNWRNLETVKTLAGRLGQSPLSTVSPSSSSVPILGAASTSSASTAVHEKLCAVPSRDNVATVVHKNLKKAQTVGAQFQHSLQSLMVALNTANPFFVRCVKSNRLKAPNQFDDEIVLRQLRYTGMLETVRIRQSGFNVRLTFDEFIHHYRILLPRGLLSSQSDVTDFLRQMNLNAEHYQIGHHKIFLRESEKAKLDHRLHQTILASIVTIQRWFRTCVERRNFVSIRNAVVRIQSYVRMFLAQRQMMNLRVRHMAATFIQKMWRGYRVRQWYTSFRSSVIQFQSRARGSLVRRRFEQMRAERDGGQREEGSSQEELDHFKELLEQLSSEESSGIQEDSETESMHSESASASGLLAVALDGIFPYPVPNEEKRRGSGQAEGTKAKAKGEAKQGAQSTTRIGSIEDLLRGDVTSRREEKAGPLSKAKQHLKTLIAGSKRPDKGEVRLTNQGSTEQDSDSENTLVSESRSTLNSAPEANAQEARAKERQVRREERKRIIAERHPIRSRTNSITEDMVPSHSPTYSNPMLHRRYSRDVDPIPSVWPSSIYGHLQSGSSGHSYSHGGLPSHLTAFRNKDSGRSYSVDSSMRSSRDSLRDSGLMAAGAGAPALTVGRKDSYVSSGSTNLSSPREGNSRPSSAASSPTVRSSLSQIHKLARTSKVSKNETCALCAKTMNTFFAHGYKCSECLLVFHAKCVQQGLSVAQALPPTVLECGRPKVSPDLGKPDRDRQGGKARKASRETVDSATENSKWNLTGTSEFTDSVQDVVNGVEQLQRLDEFIARKIHQLGNQGGDADRVFLSALREFKGSMLSVYSVVAAQGDCTAVQLSYRDLIANFDKIVDSVSRHDARKTFPKTLAVNAFRGFLNEYMAERRPEDKDAKDKLRFKGKRRKDRWKQKQPEKNRREPKRVEPALRYLGHEFAMLNSVITIPTACEVCSSFTWLKEKGLVCQSCKLTCHKKCYTRITAPCPAPANTTPASGSGSASAPLVLPKTVESTGGHLFGVSLEKLVGAAHRLPPTIERLVSTIELVGLYTEGLYRKSGVSSRVQQLKKQLEEEMSHKDGSFVVDLKDQPVHVLTAVLKAFLRELPQPLLTYERYDQFLRAADIADDKERISFMMALVQELPQAHFDLLERLVFHLTRVALNEKSNRMNANALAIVFAPCILRTSKLQQAQDSLSNVGKQTTVVESILTEQLRRVSDTLADIDSLDSACLAYAARLCTLRSSKMYPPSSASSSPCPSALGLPSGSERNGASSESTSTQPSFSHISSSGSTTDAVSEEMLIQQQLDELREEKAALAATLPSLARTASDEDLLSTDGDLDGEEDSPTGGSMDDIRSNSTDPPRATVLPVASVKVSGTNVVFKATESVRNQQAATTTTTTAAAAAAAAAAAKRRFDANKVVITVGGLHKKNEPDDWEKRLSAGRRAFEEQAQLLLREQKESPVKSVTLTSASESSGRKLNLTPVQRTRTVDCSESSSTPTHPSPSVERWSVDPAQGRSKLNRLKPLPSSPLLGAVDSSDPSVIRRNGWDVQRNNRLLDPHQTLQTPQQPAQTNNKMRKRRDSPDNSDGSVLSSYQHTLEVDLDDDAIMV